MVQENWRRVATPGFETLYEVSDLGRVRRAKSGHVLKPGAHPKGYWNYTLANGVRKNALGHRLVLEAFAGPCPEDHEARHLDGNRKNNQLGNLIWGTSSENEDDKKGHDTVAYGERNGMARLTTGQVQEIIHRCESGETQQSIARAFGIKQPQVSRLVNGKRWGHLKPTAKAS